MPKKRILVVDDEIGMNELVKVILELENFEVNQAYNGKDALKTLDQVKADLIILNIMMSDKSGWDVVAEIKQKKHLEKIPIVLLSAQDDPISRDFSKLCTQDYIVVKPLKKDELLHRIKKHL